MQNNQSSFLGISFLVNLPKVTTKAVAEKPGFCFSKEFEQTIWKMVAVPGKPVLVLELRDDARRQVRFSALNYLTGEFLWEQAALPEPWWVSLFDADEEKIFCRRFQTTSNPDDVVWMTLALADGKEVEPVERSRSQARPSNVILPSQYVQGHPYFDQVGAFLKAKLKTDAVSAMEYLESGGLVFVSFYVASGKEFENHLAVFDESGSMIWSEKLGGALPGIGLETFFLRDARLFFVKNKRELVVFQL